VRFGVHYTYDIAAYELMVEGEGSLSLSGDRCLHGWPANTTPNNIYELILLLNYIMKTWNSLVV